MLAAQGVEEQIKIKRKERKHLLKEQAAATHNIGSPSSDPSMSLQDRTENMPDEFIVGPSFEMIPDVDVMSISGDSQQCADSDSSMASCARTPLPPSSLSAVPLVHSNLKTFKMEYHPKSGCATSIETFSIFGHKQDQQPSIVVEEHWQPFSCCADFEFAELAHNAALNKDHTDALLWLIWRIVDGQANITFKSHCDVSVAWDRAASQMTPFKKHTITTWHKQEDLMFDSSLPENAVPFAFILYADKMHLSSTGTVKAYPVFAHCGNLPVHIRNTDRLGGERMVPEDSEEDGKLSYVNLKCVVWLEGFFKLLKTIILYAKTGWLCTFTVHKSTIEAGKAKDLEFQMHLEEYITIIDETDPDAIKNWNFPKMHTSKHIFDDIIAKGAADNFST
ncbi:uncharacterized protein F5891DRAFT_1187429 [Suillus fuscotomentosus]|uniref:Uncharacterized protein n=1 Tax=Suillus fuscotomentosus TaxID=1912939 RepID=A0AAD4E8A9_9AGAM|nr:uncharacterized protein F5891DRAFT_1187429 [Suillus fuscotomentosus]KAG1901570.1 hypothetical protein F5891DRAFT_1187429 [Suillus fuscotomentosus]